MIDRQKAAASVDTIISGAVIITMDAQRRVIKDGALAMTGDRIAGVGRRTDVVRDFHAANVIDGRRFVLTPGALKPRL